ncbi:MAG: Stp1/IreP family PP2C-type Ser/Thr phosphatase [Eubacteriales bacterium]|nr:Stp1/IreP family PP2C-type Ser/Thr phosphatase [Eubacteriales bacterium]
MLQIGFKCNRGVVRKNNEDACFVIPNKDVYIVADGVGGNNSGEIASGTAVEELAAYVKAGELDNCNTPEEIFGFFTKAVDVANKKVFDISSQDPACRGMATTLVMTYIHQGVAYLTNIGDSRAYLFRNGRLKRITKDHTYVNELIDQGVITEKEAETHNQKNVITKALGAEPAIEPDFYRVGLAEGDIMLLCSDGLYGEVGEDRIQEMLKAAIAGDMKMNDLCADFVDEAILAGGRDNITVIAIRI